MYAIIETGGKQYQVREGDLIDVELLEGESEIRFDRVLFLHDGETARVGAPHVPHCIVHGELVGEIKGPKVFAFKYTKRETSRRKVGHRQKYSRVKITRIAAA